MKKLLLSAIFMVGTFVLSAQVSVDPATYDEVDGMAVKPLWGWYTGLNNASYGSVGIGTRGMVITPDGTQMLIPNRVAHNDIYIDVYNTETGVKIKSLKISDDIWYRGKNDDGTDKVSEWNANDIAIDAAGNVLLWKMVFNVGTATPECFVVNMENGNVTPIQLNPIEGAEGRYDYFAVYGDIVNGDGYILSPCTNPNDEVWGTIIAKWNYRNGVLQPAVLDDLISISSYYPTAATHNGGGSRVFPISDELFYLDGSNTFPTLYNMDGTIADDFSKIADADMRTSVQPLAASNNGIAEFSIGDKNFAIFTISNQLQTPWTAMRLVSWDANMSFASMKPLYNLPKDGMGDISNGERTHVPAIHVNSTTGLARIVMFCGRGGAAAYDFGTKEAIEAAYSTGIDDLKNGSELVITTAKGQVILSEVGNIEVYGLGGQKIADKFLATSINLEPGAYIVKATNGSGTVTSKVIIE